MDPRHQAETRKISFNFPGDMKYHLGEKNGRKKCVTWLNIPITREDTNITVNNEAKTEVVDGSTASNEESDME